MKPVYIKTIVVVALLSLACTTKVSEWVLLNYIPDSYTLVYYHKEPVAEPVRQQIREIESKTRSANVLFRTMAKGDIKDPYYALYYNNRLFSEYSDYKSVSTVTFSPLREKIAAELMTGKLCVMLYLKSGNQDKDTKGLQVLKNSIASSPFGEIITVVELNRSSADEKHLVSMLLNVESDLKDIMEPMLFGIFGRFRALEPLLAKGITEENIGLMIDFLTADCSCLIKDDLPGINILYDGTWENPLPAMVNKIFDEDPTLLHN